jgi:hypothetical protein
MWVPSVSGYAATWPALIGQEGWHPLSPRVRLKDCPDSAVRRPRAPIRARPVRSHAEVVDPSALHHHLHASASVSGAAHSIEAEHVQSFPSASSRGRTTRARWLPGWSAPSFAQCHWCSWVASPPPSFHPEMLSRCRSCDVLAMPPPR